MEEVRVSENANQIPPEFVADGTMAHHSHLYHRDCVEGQFGSFPRATRHVPRRGTRVWDRREGDEDEDEDDEDMEDLEDDDDDDDAQKRLCPRCPKCNMQDDACVLNLDTQKHCDPVMTVFLDTVPDDDEKVNPVTITVDGEARARFDLAHLASRLGAEMDDLYNLVERGRTQRDEGAIEMGVRIKDKHLADLIKDLVKIKAEQTLAVSQSYISLH